MVFDDLDDALHAFRARQRTFIDAPEPR